MNAFDEKDIAKIDGLLEEIIGEEGFERQLELAEELLKIAPDNPLAWYIKWQALGDEESDENISILKEAIETLEEELDGDSVDEIDEMVRSFYSAMLSDMASHHYFKGEKEEALARARRFMQVDCDCHLIGRLVYYACLIERGGAEDFAEVIDAADSDIYETPIAAHSRAIALYETEGASQEASDALIEAVSMDPDMVFYVLGLWTFEDQDDEEEMDDLGEDMEDLLLHIAILSELWSAKEERLAFLGVVAFAFGYMTGRLESNGDVGAIEDGYKGFGCLEEMREARDTVQALVASGKEPEEVDEEALMIFRDMRDRGLFS